MDNLEKYLEIYQKYEKLIKYEKVIILKIKRTKYQLLHQSINLKKINLLMNAENKLKINVKKTNYSYIDIWNNYSDLENKLKMLNNELSKTNDEIKQVVCNIIEVIKKESLKTINNDQINELFKEKPIIRKECENYIFISRIIYYYLIKDNFKLNQLIEQLKEKELLNFEQIKAIEKITGIKILKIKALKY